MLRIVQLAATAAAVSNVAQTTLFTSPVEVVGANRGSLVFLTLVNGGAGAAAVTLDFAGTTVVLSVAQNGQERVTCWLDPAEVLKAQSDIAGVVAVGFAELH
jgi:hypothetical protein